MFQLNHNVQQSETGTTNWIPIVVIAVLVGAAIFFYWRSNNE